MSTISSSSILSKVTLLAMLDRDKVTSIVGQLYRNVFRERVAEVLCMVDNLMCTVDLNTGNIISSSLYISCPYHYFNTIAYAHY